MTAPTPSVAVPVCPCGQLAVLKTAGEHTSHPNEQFFVCPDRTGHETAGTKGVFQWVNPALNDKRSYKRTAPQSSAPVKKPYTTPSGAYAGNLAQTSEATVAAAASSSSSAPAATRELTVAQPDKLMERVATIEQLVLDVMLQIKALFESHQEMKSHVEKNLPSQQP